MPGSNELHRGEESSNGQSRNEGDRRVPCIIAGYTSVAVAQACQPVLLAKRGSAARPNGEPKKEGFFFPNKLTEQIPSSLDFLHTLALARPCLSWLDVPGLMPK
jgi:hypothetical protein